MKKITLLLMITLLSTVGFSQTTVGSYTFDTDLDSWVAGNGAVVEYDATNYFTAAGSLKFSGNNNKVAKVVFDITDGGTITGAGEYRVTYKIKSADAANVIRTQIRYNGSVDQLGDDPTDGTLSGGDGDATWTEIQYTFTLDGSAADCQLQLKRRTGGAVYYVDDVLIERLPCNGYAVVLTTDGGGTAEISSPLPCYPTGTNVEITATPSCANFTFDQWEVDGTPTGDNTNPYTYTVGSADVEIKALFTATATAPDTNFDTDAELGLWVGNGASTVTVANDDLTWEITNTNPKITYSDCSFAPETWNINGLRIGYTNNTTNTRLRLNTTNGDGTSTYLSYDGLDTSGTAGQELIMPIGQLTDFISEMAIQIKADDQNSNATNGTFVIDYIEFYYDPALSVSNHELTTLTIYPNPADDVVNFSTTDDISKVQIFDITGKIVLDVQDFNNNQVNVSSLQNGIYLIKVIDFNNNYSTRKLVIK